MTVQEFVNSLGELPSLRREEDRRLAQELVLGTYENLWEPTILTVGSSTVGGEVQPTDPNLREYMTLRWGDSNIGRRLQRLEGRGYIISLGNGREKLTPLAFDLVD